MSRVAGPIASVPLKSCKVVWFAPDRPVEGNTIYVRPANDVERDEESEESTDAVPSDR